MLHLTREQILAQRRRVSGLHERVSLCQASVESVAAVGLQDSMPRAALLSIHARISGVGPTTWKDSPLVQVWGPRFNAFVIADRDLAVFTLSRLPDDANGRRRAEEVADRLAAVLGDERMDVRDAARRLGLHPNALRYAAPTGEFLIHWDGARQPLIWRVPAPAADPFDARLELARRFLHVLGPGTPASFALWAGLPLRSAREAFEALQRELIAVWTPGSERQILAADESAFRSADGVASTRLLPSGDSYYLRQGEDRELLVPDPELRRRLWTSRVWPGALLLDGEIVGTWRRSEHRVIIHPWIALGAAHLEAVESEAASLPLPGVSRPIAVSWG